ncbi:DUF2169 domain-containing protein [Undibacterium sp. Jales W-56]|uniref:DUF2169 family type VI secretion system accessory protein n=1 Tax=Undibacterium sp. Jales W-56 TaxID=2897325 RepID=UPI0021D18BE4|nr:DUF2169 domain-containing protein [Undibacterium sp. Jales W-56]MCU6432912.1 DUF2169 domain-containing protein [Undibacterium sp. Jales W-56]
MLIPIQSPEKVNQPELTIPTLLFENRTDYAALHFDTLDQHRSAFHIIVTKIAYQLKLCDAKGFSTLEEIDNPAELNTEDHYYEDDFTKGVQAESDLAPYKPFCDVIVNALAYPPKKSTASRFSVGIRVEKPDLPAPLPKRPAPLNPLQSLSPAVFEEWQKELAVAKNSRLPGEILIDKTLEVCGERWFIKWAWPVRLCMSVIRICTLGILVFNPWRLTRAKKCDVVPVRYNLAQGGECRIELIDKAAKRVGKKYRLTDEQRSAHPDKDNVPIAHEACLTNPLGQGFLLRWFLEAKRIARFRAPQIDYPKHALTSYKFWQQANGKNTLIPAGLGFLGRAWTPRRELVGQVKMKPVWSEEEFPVLPENFDFRYWNGAPADQQCTHLSAEERFTLTNLSHPDSAHSQTDANGNTLLQFRLPRQSFFVMAIGAEGQVEIHPLLIDTVTIDVEAARVDLVWRLCLPADGSIDQARLMHAKDSEQLKRLQELLILEAQELNVSNAPLSS